MMKQFAVYLFTIFTILCLKIQNGQSKDTYLVGIQNQWFQGSDATLFVSIYDKSVVNTNVQVTLNIVKADNAALSYQVKSSFGSPNSRGLISFQVPTYFKEGYYNVTIEGRAGSFRFKNFTQNIQFRTDTKGIYILTDKPVYRALDQVNVKVVGVDFKLLPISKNLISLYFLDPSQNIIKQYLDLSFTQGLIENVTLDISDKPQLGSYSIKVVEKENGNTVYQNFEIKEYVLPKFDFTVSPPDYVLKTDDFFQGTIDAKYTYGKALEGEAYVKLEAQQYYWINSDSGNQAESYNFKVERIIKLSNGKITFNIPVMAFNTYSLTLTVNVTEQFTKETQQKVFYISVYDKSFTASIDPSVFVSGTNSLTLSLTDPVNKPLSNLSLGVDYTFIVGPLDSQLNKVSYAVKTGIDGKAPITIDAPNSATQIIINVKRLDNNEITKLIIFKKKASISSTTENEFLFQLPENLRSNTIGTILVARSNDSSNSLTCYNVAYMMVSRSKILNTGTIQQLCNNQQFKEIKLQITTSHAPYSTLVLYYINSTNSLVVQSNRVDVSGLYNNEISLQFDATIAEPGQSVKLSINSKPNSVASIAVIDQSVALLRTPNDLTDDLILSQISRYQTNWYYSSTISRKKRQIPFNDGYWQFPKSLQVLEGNGFTVLSDLSSLEPTFQKFEFFPVFAAAAAPGGAAFANDAVRTTTPANVRAQASGSSESLASVDRIRTNFLETWIWSTVKTDQFGKATIQSQIPDTITSWIASGFALSNTYGLAIANKTNITGFKSFFVSLNLPSSIIRGEVFTLQAIVSNFLNVDLTNVKVTLSKSTAFKSVSVANNTYRYNDVINDIVITIPSISSNSQRSVTFPITATKVGLIDLTVKAQSTVAADGLTQKLRVKFEGIQESYNLPYSIDLGSSTWLTRSGVFSERVSLTFPSNTIQDSQYCEVQVIGDLLGVAFSNLDQLIVKPYGCGEQNMLTLTPNIYAYNYLQVVRRTDSQSLIDKTKANILFGYQNQLKYRRFDGSFSAFGIIDDSGSSWLTAFVVKSFAQAAKIVQIDQNVITTAITWLLQQQNDDGSFREPGYVIHKDMQSGVNSNETQAAYITISLLETNITTSDVTNGIRKALGYLESRLSSINDVYALSLITYALTLGGSSSSQTAFNKFNALANTTSAGLKYWSKPESDSYSSYYWRRYVPTNGIEMTSYGLLIYLLRNDISGSVPIVRWLVSKTNSLGAYGSTQSTVLGLQSLSTFGVRTNAGGSFDLTIRVDATATQFTTFKVNNNNTLVLQSWQVSPCPSALNLSASGTGSAFLQIIATYNVPKLTEPPVFELHQIIKSRISSSNYLLETCARYTGKDGASGMSIIESNIVSGFSADENQLANLVNASLGLKLVELSKDRSKVSFYFDKLTADRKCVAWNIKRDYAVTLQQPVSVRVYDYYKPELQTTVLFNIDNNVSICDLANGISGCKSN